MTTQLTKPVKRRSNELRRDKGKFRPIIVTIYPAGYIGFRLEGTRKEETILIEAALERAIRSRLALEKIEKAKARKERRLNKW